MRYIASLLSIEGDSPLARYVQEELQRIEASLQATDTQIYKTISADHVVGDECLIFADATSGNITVDLPVLKREDTRILVIKKIDASANTVTLDAGSTTVDDTGAVAITKQYAAYEVYWAGDQWYLLGSSVSGGTGGVTDHTLLTSIGVHPHTDIDDHIDDVTDDHLQYHNDARGDARYYRESEIDTMLADKVDKAGDTMTGTLNSDHIIPTASTKDLGSTSIPFNNAFAKQVVGAFTSGSGSPSLTLQSTSLGGIMAGSATTGGAGTPTLKLDGGGYPAIACIGRAFTQSGGTSTVESTSGGAVVFGSAYSTGSAGVNRVTSSGDSSFAVGYAYGGGTNVVEATTPGSFVQGYAKGGKTSSVRSTGYGSFAQGFAVNSSPLGTSEINASSKGAFAQGYVGGAFGSVYLHSKGFGSFAQGYVRRGGIYATTNGSIAQGYCDGTRITSSGKGSIAAGSALSSTGIIEATANGAVGIGTANGGTIQANSPGSFAQGQCADGKITASGGGAFAQGKVYGGTGEVTASGTGSMARGYATLAKIKANGVGAVAIGRGYYGSILAYGSGAFAQGFAYYNKVSASGFGSFAQGRANRGQVTASGIGSFAQGVTLSGDIITSGAGSFSQGYAKTSGQLSCTGTGAFVQGYANSATLSSSGKGSFTQGYNKSGTFSAYANGSGVQGFSNAGYILAFGIGSLARGYALTGGIMTASGTGTVCMGRAENSNTINASGTGSIIVGHASNYSMTTTSAAKGSAVFGAADTAAITASASNAFQFGPGTNGQTKSLQVGTTMRLNGTTTAPTTPQNGDAYVDGVGDMQLYSGGAFRNVTVMGVGGTSPDVYAHITVTTAQNHGGANGTVQYVDWDGSEIHKDTGFTHSTVTNPSRVQVDADGRYELKWSIGCTNTGANSITLMSHYRVNGTTVVTRGRQRNYSRGTAYGDISIGMVTELDLTNGDYIEVGTTVDDADATYTVNSVPAECELIIRKVA